MTILRSQHKKGNFVILSKNFLQDKTLSLKAKGLLAYLLSLPDDWKIYVNELSVHSTDGSQATRSAIKELINRGYITYERKRNDSGTFSQGQYIITEEAKVNIEADPQLENPNVVNESLLRNNISKEKIKNTTASMNIAQSVTSNRDSSYHYNAAGTGVDQFIGNELSSNQQHAIRLACLELQSVTSLSKEQLYHCLTASILDRTSFTHAGSDFSKKLNTLKKCIRNKKWTPQVVSKPQKKTPPIAEEYSHEKWLARMRELTGNKDFVPPAERMTCREALQQARTILGKTTRRE